MRYATEPWAGYETSSYGRLFVTGARRDVKRDKEQPWNGMSQLEWRAMAVERRTGEPARRRAETADHQVKERKATTANDHGETKLVTSAR